MRISDWKSVAPHRESMSAKVLAVVEPVLAALGAEADPHVWIVWGDDPSVRYLVMTVTPGGLLVCSVRVNVPGEGPRAAARVSRWSRVQVGELAIETAPGGTMLMSTQLEGQVIRAVGDEAPAAAAFAQAVLAAMEGRPLPDLDAVAGKGRRRRTTRAVGRSSTAKRRAARRPAPSPRSNPPRASSA
jgi:hypothetical protein